MLLLLALSQLAMEELFWVESSLCVEEETAVIWQLR